VEDKKTVMKTWGRIAAVGIALTMAAVCGRQVFASAGEQGDQEVWQFNQKFQDAHARMDTTAIIGMWSETGVSLLPETPPIVGKAAVTNFIRDAVSNLNGYKMLKAEMTFHDIRVCGQWATEWGIEHQVIQPPEDKPVIDHWGKIALVLHREADGNWRVQQEMWNSTPKPE
jgi:ketosteroid isomerase-like protein